MGCVYPQWPCQCLHPGWTAAAASLCCSQGRGAWLSGCWQCPSPHLHPQGSHCLWVLPAVHRLLLGPQDKGGGVMRKPGRS